MGVGTEEGCVYGGRKGGGGGCGGWAPGWGLRLGVSVPPLSHNGGSEPLRGNGTAHRAPRPGTAAGAALGAASGPAAPGVGGGVGGGSGCPRGCERRSAAEPPLPWVPPPPPPSHPRVPSGIPPRPVVPPDGHRVRSLRSLRSPRGSLLPHLTAFCPPPLVALGRVPPPPHCPPGWVRAVSVSSGTPPSPLCPPAWRSPHPLWAPADRGVAVGSIRTHTAPHWPNLWLRPPPLPPLQTAPAVWESFVPHPLAPGPGEHLNYPPTPP